MTTERTTQPMLPGLRVPANRVSRRAISYWTARAVLSGVVVLVIALIVAGASGFSAIWIGVLVIVGIAMTAHAVIMPRWRYRVHRWEVTDQALYTRSGWFSVH